MARDCDTKSERGSVSLEVAILSPAVIALVALVVAAGSIAQANVRLQSAAEAYASEVAHGSAMKDPQLMSSYRFVVTSNSESMVCVQARTTLTGTPDSLANWFAHTQLVSAKQACSPVAP